MAQDLIIYFSNRRFVIAQKIEKYFEGNDADLFFGSPTQQDFPKLIEIFQNHQVVQNLFVGNSDVEKMFEQFASNFTVLDAAGGLVQNEKGEFLLIHRRHKWDLPKGKVEVGEELEVAALREVEEETGVSGLSVLRHLVTTYHTYKEGSNHILKRTHWYAMKCYGNMKLIPQVEEDIVKAEWVAENILPHYLNNTFANIQLVFKSFK